MGNPTALIDDIQRMTPIDPAASNAEVCPAVTGPVTTAVLARPLTNTRFPAERERTMAPWRRQSTTGAGEPFRPGDRCPHPAAPEAT